MQCRLNKLITKLFCAQLFSKQDNVFRFVVHFEKRNLSGTKNNEKLIWFSFHCVCFLNMLFIVDLRWTQIDIFWLALAVIYFKQWSIILFVLLAAVNFICILRYDAPKRENFSIVTSTVISMFTPFVSSDQTHKAQTIINNNENQTKKTETMQQKKTFS